MDVLEMRKTVREADIEAFVDRFYGRIRDDAVLGPIFAARIARDGWPEHLARMRRFWSTVLRGTGTYRGDPMGVHRQIPGLEPEHFRRWLSLFGEVLHGIVAPDVATAILSRAGRMAESLVLSRDPFARWSPDPTDPDG